MLFRRSLVLYILALGILFVGSSVTSAQTVDDLVKLNIASEEKRAFEMVNTLRTEAGLPPLKWNDTLASLARAHSADMLAYNYLDHTNHAGQSVVDRMAAMGIPSPELTGENIMRTKDYVDPIPAAVTGWKNSSKHYQNIIYPDYTEAGIGIVQSTDLSTVYLTQDFRVKPSVGSLLGTSLTGTTTSSPIPDQASLSLEATPDIVYTDVCDCSEFAPFVKTLTEKHIISGQKTGVGKGALFHGDDAATREQVATMLVRALQLTIEPTASAPLSDISSSTLIAEIATAYNNNIIRGFPDGTFRPMQPVTRGEAATMISRAFQLNGTATLPYSDVPATSSHLAGITALFEKGIIQGRTTILFAPQETVTRFEITKMIAKTIALQ